MCNIVQLCMMNWCVSAVLESWDIHRVDWQANSRVCSVDYDDWFRVVFLAFCGSAVAQDNFSWRWPATVPINRVRASYCPTPHRRRQSINLQNWTSSFAGMRPTLYRLPSSAVEATSSWSSLSWKTRPGTNEWSSYRKKLMEWCELTDCDCSICP